MVRSKHQLLDLVIELRDALEHGLHRVRVRDIASGQHRERTETDRAAQEPTAIDLLHQRVVLVQRALIDAALGTEDRRRESFDRHYRLLQCRSRVSSGSTTGPPVIIAPIVVGTSSASATCTTRNPQISTMPIK